MHKIKYLPIAEEDLSSAVKYLAETLSAPKAAAELLDELDETVNRLAQFPYAHELYRTDRPMKDEIRKVPIKDFVLYYTVLQDCVEIHRFLHGRRDRSNMTYE
ncbi:MAG: type II toxin-antitoxin system RelE/ParE family toxin [Oscillospiraceae bacterium]|nr:type II toxin-antitoxin system RelE/ParE family toxin [Oscillospiraceae bacterium]